jgi:nickel/cobalt transporter (NicO) family protein
MNKGYFLLLISTFSIAFLHSLAPDHWMPFAVIGKAQKWSKAKLAWITFVSGIGHVGSSILVGTIGIFLGFSIAKLKAAESHRGEIALWLLTGFGIAYMGWGLKKARDYKHEHIDAEKLKSKTVTLWTLFAIFVLGPCEPLIPLMFLATDYGWSGILLTSLAFSVVTIGMMLGQSLLAYAGIQLIRHDIAERYSHAFAGFVIFLTGAFVMLLGI